MIGDSIRSVELEVKLALGLGVVGVGAGGLAGNLLVDRADNQHRAPAVLHLGERGHGDGEVDLAGLVAAAHLKDDGFAVRIAHRAERRVGDHRIELIWHQIVFQRIALGDSGGGVEPAQLCGALRVHLVGGDAALIRADQ